jgi:phosphomevalonate kinase
LNIISLSARRKTGKTLAADLIVSLDNRFKKLSFASYLKDAFSAERGIKREDLNDVLIKERYRQEMQLWGDKKRAENPYLFVTRLLENTVPTGFYVIDDCRFIPEVETLVKLGAKPYGMYSEPKFRRDRGWVFDPEVDNHVSETELGDLCAYTWHCLGGGYLYNNKSKEDLKKSLSLILSTHFPYTVEDLESLNKYKKKIIA